MTSSSSPRRPQSPAKRSEPIPINTQGRKRSESVSSYSSSSTNSPELSTPLNSSSNIPRIGIANSGSSPVLSYFLAQQSPTNKSSTFPFRRNFGSNPVFEEEFPEQKEPPVTAHTRRASVSVAERFTQPGAQPLIPEPQQERGSGLLRRLSLSSAAFNKPTLGKPPSPPPNTAISPTNNSSFSQDRRPRRAATLSVQQPCRAPSPMGERILKGHFDGFN